jgi:phosphoribosylanthranilate isomerase
MKIKICGLTKPEEAQYLNKNQVDFAGMVLFFPKSKRNITISQAKKIISKLNSDIKSVAVVVSPSISEIEQIETAGFDYIQIHGELTEEMLGHIHLPIIKAFNIVDMDKYEQYHACPQVTGYVFDAIEPGSGKTFDWSLVKNIPRDEKMLLLAGGLNPENVGEAIGYLRPDGVDVSSGVEYTDRLGKDAKKVDLFVANARKIL